MMEGHHAAQRPTAGGAHPVLSGALYARQTPPTAEPTTSVAKAPARGGGRALRGGGQARLYSAQERGARHV